jgi:hypothetical protein
LVFGFITKRRVTSKFEALKNLITDIKSKVRPAEGAAPAPQMAPGASTHKKYKYYY